jgi:CheY-like chemotaxis protein
MKKRVLDIGNCSPDHEAIRRLIEEQFEAEVAQAHGWNDAAGQLGRQSFDLVLVNRLLDRDGREGLEIIRLIKSDERLRAIPVMLVTNYEEHQQQAVEAGALPGFGKRSIREPETVEKLRTLLD